MIDPRMSFSKVRRLCPINLLLVVLQRSFSFLEDLSLLESRCISFLTMVKELLFPCPLFVVLEWYTVIQCTSKKQNC